MEWHAAVAAAGEGITIDVEVQPGARGMHFPAGFNEWRNTLGIKVHAPPEGEKANREVTSLIAKFFGVQPGRVVIEAGHHASRKRIGVVGVEREAALARLADEMPDE